MPANKKIDNPQEIYQIKVTLLGANPPIWRRLLVPADMTLRQLHDVLQVAVGWQDCHMHAFSIGEKRFAIPDPNDHLMGLPASGDERTARLFTVLGKAGAKAAYNYDFGDDWEHGITVEKVLPPEPGEAYPFASPGNVTVRPKTVAAYQGSTICWKRSPIRNTRNTTSCSIGWAAILIPRLFWSTKSTAA